MEDSSTMKRSLKFRDEQSTRTMGQKPFKLEIKFVILVPAPDSFLGKELA